MRDPGVNAGAPPQKECTSDMNQRDTERERLLTELAQLEEAARALDLRDRAAWELHQRKLQDLRERIRRYEKSLGRPEN